MASFSLESVNKFLVRVQQSNQSRSRELRLTIDESQELANTIGLLLARHIELTEKILDLQKQQTKPDTIIISGGKL
jgi:hypothetical protein